MLKLGGSVILGSLRFCIKCQRQNHTIYSQIPPSKMRHPFTNKEVQAITSLTVDPKQAFEVFVKEPERITQTIKVITDELKSVEESISKLSSTTQSKDDSGLGSENNHEQEREERRKRMEKNTKIAGLVLLCTITIGAISFALYYGRAERDSNGLIIKDQYSELWLAPVYRIYNSIWKWRDYVVEPAREILLPDPLPAPYLQPKYTLVLEMKNFLVSPQWTYKTGHRFMKRPGLEYFLDVVGYPNFEVVIYTSESAMGMMNVIDVFDPNHRIMFRLFRDCTKYSDGHHKKDLSKLNRDLSKVIYIDFDAAAGSLCPENLLLVPEWKGNFDDLSLIDLAELLKTIHLSDVDDVRPTLQYYSQFEDPASEFKKRALYVAQNQENETQKATDMPITNKYRGQLFGFRRHQQL